MEVLHLTRENVDSCAARAAEVLRAGGVVLYPTDTLYGLGADAFSDAAVAKVYAIKGREEGKPIHAIVSDLEMAGKYGDVTNDATRLVAQLPKGLLTLIVKKKDVQSGIAKDIETFGFRIPGNDLCIELVRAFGGPVTATSANKSEEVPERSVEKILEQLGGNAKYVDLVIDVGELPRREPSSVVDLCSPEPAVLREAAVSAQEIRSILGH